MTRGEIWLAGLDPVRGSEQAGTRPVLVLQADPLQAEMPKVSFGSSAAGREDRTMEKVQGTRYGARGFTLIELLVVIVVLGILAALLFPTFAKARREAQVSGCLSNLHQIGLAIRMYESDWGGKLPRDAYDPSQPARPQIYQLQPYLRSPGSLKCPSGWINNSGYRYHWSPVPRTTLRPQAGTVVALCLEHLERHGGVWNFSDGLVTVVREDASAAKVLAGQVELWNYGAGTWIRNNGFGPPDYLRFPGEPWPPEFGP
jgi:prepilin-type N-terminal cleavage/methylation domain-containing protein